MNLATKYIECVKSMFSGEVDKKYDFIEGIEFLHPFIVEDERGNKIGCIGLASDFTMENDFVQVMHVRAYEKNIGSGTKIMNILCAKANEFGVRLFIEPEQLDETEFTKGDLIIWYSKMGFVSDGKFGMERPPNA